jgi:hypothetical protein
VVKPFPGTPCAPVNNAMVPAVRNTASASSTSTVSASFRPACLICISIFPFGALHVL